MLFLGPRSYSQDFDLGLIWLRFNICETGTLVYANSGTYC